MAMGLLSVGHLVGSMSSPDCCFCGRDILQSPYPSSAAAEEKIKTLALGWYRAMEESGTTPFLFARCASDLCRDWKITSPLEFWLLRLHIRVGYRA